MTDPDNDWVIFGAGSQGRVVLEMLHVAGRRVLGFVDERLAATPNAQAHGLPVWAQLGEEDRRRVTAFVAIGDSAARQAVAQRLRAEGVRVGTVVHPTALAMPSAMLGSGVLVCPRAFVGVGTAVADDAVLNTGASVDHESIVGAGAYLAPGVTTAGKVRIGRGAFIGLGALLGPNVHIGDHAVVAAGAAVLESVPDATMVAGVPARVRRRLPLPLDYGRLLAGCAAVREVRHAG